MILQIDLRLNMAIQKAGCYLMCILYFVNKYTNFVLSTVVINNLYLVLQTVIGRRGKPCLDFNCYVEDCNKIFNHLGFKVKYTGVHESPNYICKTNEFEILCLRHVDNHRLFHFVCGDGKGNETYNPTGLSNPNYELYSKRIFVIL